MAYGKALRDQLNDPAYMQQLNRASAFARQGARMDNSYKSGNRGSHSLQNSPYVDPLTVGLNRINNYNVNNPIAPNVPSQSDRTVGNSTQSEASGNAQENRDKIFNLAQTGLDEARNNPVDQMILDALQNRSTTDVPYDQKTINQLMTQGSEASAARYANEQKSLDKMAGRAGVNKSDPAYIAMQRESKERQTASNTNNRRNIQSDARVENYNAQGRGLQDLGGANTRYRNRIDNRSDNLGGLYGREVFRSGQPDTQYKRQNQGIGAQNVNFNGWQNAPKREQQTSNFDWSQVQRNSMRRGY